MIKIIALFGPSGSGKDTILQTALEKMPNLLHKPVFYTTRPPREKEKNGVDYHFVTKEEFEEKLLNGELIEASVFNGWGYGSSVDNYSKDKVNIIAIDNTRLENLIESGVSEHFTVYPMFVRASDKTRLLRQLKREDNPNVDEIIRRFESDKNDYKFIAFPYHSLQNENKTDLKAAVEELRQKVKNM